MDGRTQALLAPLREAVQARRIACIGYADEQGRASVRRIRPLGCFFSGKVWTVAEWCELRQDFRGVRIDRIAALQVLDGRFALEPGRTLPDLLRQTRGQRRESPA